METETTEKSYGYKLLEESPKGTTLFTALRCVSPEGMYRVKDSGEMKRIIDVKLIQDNKARNIIVQELEARWGYRVTGGGMDIGFWLVYELGSLVHKDGDYFNHR